MALIPPLIVPKKPTIPPRPTLTRPTLPTLPKVPTREEIIASTRPPSGPTATQKQQMVEDIKKIEAQQQELEQAITDAQVAEQTAIAQGMTQDEIDAVKEEALAPVYEILAEQTAAYKVSIEHAKEVAQKTLPPPQYKEFVSQLPPTTTPKEVTTLVKELEEWKTTYKPIQRELEAPKPPTVPQGTMGPLAPGQTYAPDRYVPASTMGPLAPGVYYEQHKPPDKLPQHYETWSQNRQLEWWKDNAVYTDDKGRRTTFRELEKGGVVMEMKNGKPEVRYLTELEWGAIIYARMTEDVMKKHPGWNKSMAEQYVKAGLFGSSLLESYFGVGTVVEGVIGETKKGILTSYIEGKNNGKWSTPEQYVLAKYEQIHGPLSKSNMTEKQLYEAMKGLISMIRQYERGDYFGEQQTLYGRNEMWLKLAANAPQWANLSAREYAWKVVTSPGFTQTVTLPLASFGLGAAAKGLFGLGTYAASRLTSSLTPAVQMAGKALNVGMKVGGLGLLGYGVYETGKHLYEAYNPPQGRTVLYKPPGTSIAFTKQIGGIGGLAKEVLPTAAMWGYAIAGARTEIPDKIKNYWVKAGATEVKYEGRLAQKIQAGEKTFPTAYGKKAHMVEWGKAYDPRVDATRWIHGTTGRINQPLTRDITVASGRKGPGLWVAPEQTPSYYFLRTGRAPYKFTFYPKSGTGPSTFYRGYGKGRVGIEPGKWYGSEYGKVWIPPETQYGWTGEIQALSPMGTKYVPSYKTAEPGTWSWFQKLKGYQYYTMYQGKAIPIRDISLVYPTGATYYKPDTYYPTGTTSSYYTGPYYYSPIVSYGGIAAASYQPYKGYKGAPSYQPLYNLSYKAPSYSYKTPTYSYKTPTVSYKLPTYSYKQPQVTSYKTSYKEPYEVSYKTPSYKPSYTPSYVPSYTPSYVPSYTLDYVPPYTPPTYTSYKGYYGYRPIRPIQSYKVTRKGEIPLKLKRKKKKEEKKGYHTYVMEKKKWKKITDSPLPLKQAKGKGMLRVDTTPSIQYKVKKSKGDVSYAPTYDLEYQKRKHKFKGGHEHKKYWFDYPGERKK